MRTQTRSPFHAAVAVELARAGLTQRQLAALLRTPDTTLSDWLLGAHPGPADLAERIERALDLKAGTLPRAARQSGRQATP
jgi:transcriptional regulator with XRE-family HTH domain